MYLRRKIDKYLVEWKHSTEHKPLIVKGARQIGKSASIAHFAENNYASFININFAVEKKYRSIVADGFDVDTITANISRIDTTKQFIPGNTLILFDELQDFPEIATALKFFCIDGRYDVICSGSLLGINYQRIESNSVGYKTNYEMFSMDFEEFLWAKGYESHIDDLLSHMQSLTPFNETTMNVFHSLFLDYCILGGMPSVVVSYIEKGTFEGTLKQQKDLLEDYKEDIRKYVTGIEQTRILHVFNRIPIQLAQDNKKFQISKVANGARFKDYWGCVEWLNDAGIINICWCMQYPQLPLKGNFDDNKYKIYLKDSGLLVACLDDEAQDDLRSNKNLNVYKGALYENIVGEALVKQGYGLYYYKRENATLEQDFFVRTKKSLVPIEVKAQNNQSKSLSTLIKSDAYEDIHWGIKLCAGNIGHNNNIYTFPYFCAFLLRRYLADKE